LRTFRASMRTWAGRSRLTCEDGLSARRSWRRRFTSERS